MGDVKSCYAVSLTLSGEIEKVLARLHRDVHPDVMNSTMPHITLVYPFMPVSDIKSVIDRLEEVAGRNSSFRLTLEGIGFFNTVNNVAYVAIKDKNPIKQLMTDIVEMLEGKIKGYIPAREFDFEKFRPHVTIAERIPPERFPDVKRKLAGCRVQQECEIEEFTLAGEEYGKWQVVRGFGLTGCNNRQPSRRKSGSR